MDPSAFDRRYRPVWSRLEAELARKRGLSVAELGRLYKEVTGHLSYARTYFPAHEVTHYLNGLVGRAHLLIYGKREGQWRDFGRFFSSEFPATLRSASWFFALSYAVMITGMAVGFVTVMQNAGALYALLPSQFIRQFHPAMTGPHAVDAPVIASLIMTHNIEVTILAFLGAFTLGVFTLYTLYQNGLILGALAAVFLRAHNSVVFWSLILPHGCIELTAIAIAGAAGLQVGYRFLAPGRQSRLASLQGAFLIGAKLLAGTMLMLMVAGTIEGFITPSGLPIPFKYAFAGLTLLLLIAYFTLSGRKGHREDKKVL